MMNSIASQVATLDTADLPLQLANISYRLDIVITILLYAFVLMCGCGVCYIIYRFLLRFI